MIAGGTVLRAVVERVDWLSLRLTLPTTDAWDWRLTGREETTR
jgi:hypothetical protein